MAPDIHRSYEALGLIPGSSFDEIKRAYRRVIKEWHPDRFHHDPHLARVANEKLKDLIPAYQKLAAYHLCGLGDRFSPVVDDASARESLHVPKTPEEQYEQGATFLRHWDYAEAAVWFSKAAQRGHAEAQLKIGALHFYGLGVEQSDVEATKWFWEAAKQGLKAAKEMLEIIYRWESGAPKNQDERVKWYREAAENGVIAAQGWLGNLYTTRNGLWYNFWEGVRWFIEAARNGHAESAFDLARLYERGCSGVLPDLSRALKWYTLAAEQDYTEAQERLGDLYSDSDSLHRNLPVAAKWYRKAAETGISHAQVRMGEMCELGEGVPQNYVEAVRWYEKAVENESFEAPFKLAELYTSDCAGLQDFVKAADWFKTADGRGYPRASLRLGEMYEKGMGVKRNIKSS